MNKKFWLGVAAAVYVGGVLFSRVGNPPWQKSLLWPLYRLGLLK